MEETAVRPRRLRRRRRRRLLPLVILLVVLAVAVPVVLSLLPHQPPVREEPDPPRGAGLCQRRGQHGVADAP